MGGCCTKRKPTVAELGQKYNLTKEQLNTYKLAFDEFDKNGDGKIVSSELYDVMIHLGYKTITLEMASEIISLVDKDKSGAIEFDEFVTLMSQCPPTAVEELDKHPSFLFRIFDKNNDGYITGDDVKVTMKSLGMKLTNEQINEMMLEADTNKDGKIDKTEFKSAYAKLMKRAS